MLADRGKFKTETFVVGDLQYLYEVENNGENSVIKVYGNDGKLRSAQRIRLPANCQVYPCEHYLVALQSSQIHLYQLPNTNTKISCPNPGLPELTLLRYNRSSNLLFLLSQNQLYYLLPQPTSLTLKKILSPKSHNIPHTITSLEIDNQSIVHLLCAENRVLYSVKFKWNSGDVVERVGRRDGVVGVYCRGDWWLLVRDEAEGEDGFFGVYVRDGNLGDIARHVQVDDDGDKKNVPKFDPSQPPLIKSTKNHLLYLDPTSKTLLLITHKEHFHQTSLSLPLPKKSTPATLLFNLHKRSHNTLTLQLLNYQPYNLEQTFTTVQVPIKLLDLDAGENLLLYLHNNIQLVLTGKGVELHFWEKVKEYAGVEGTVDGDTLACRFLEKLCEESPLTVVKLANHFCKQGTHTYLPSQLSRYIFYISHIISTLPFISIFQNSHQQQQQFFSPQALDPRHEKQHYNEYKSTKAKLQSMITFVSIILHAIKGEEADNFNGGGRGTGVIAGNKNMEEENGNGDGDCSGYYRIVGRCKTVYLLNQIYYADVRERMQASGEGLIMMNSNESRILSSIIQQPSLIEQQSSPPKIGTGTCHQLFDESLAALPNPSTQKLPTKQLIHYLSSCDNFYHAAYFYLYQDRQATEIPYIGDGETVDLIRFLVDSPVSAIRDRGQLKRVYRSLPKMAGKALLINEPAFLQYICSLSINTSEFKSCLAIILSGVGREWSPKTHPFIIQCLIQCNRTLLAYSNVQSLARNEKQRKILLDQLINGCIRERRIKDLLQISSETDSEAEIKQKLSQAFGEDIREVIQLMDKLSHEES